jgi:site-specific recombinase XerD
MLALTTYMEHARVKSTYGYLSSTPQLLGNIAQACEAFLKETAADMRNWLAVRGNTPACELFVNARGLPMTRSGFEYILQKHVKTAAQAYGSLQKKRVSPHVLRHTSAMLVLQATGDIRKVALWLGHDDIQTTEVYLRADPTEKLEAIDAAVPPTLKRGEFRVPDKLIALLHSD